MTTYTATIRHSSISRAREITINGSLTSAKRRASREFGGEQRDYDIVIYNMDGGQAPDLVSARRVGGRLWRDR